MLLFIFVGLSIICSICASASTKNQVCFKWSFVCGSNTGVFKCHRLDSSPIASNDFTYTANEPQGSGIWKAWASCYTTFTANYDENTAYMVARFGVPVFEYQDNLAGGVADTDPDGRWVISLIRYGSSSGSLTYTLNFKYSTWLNYIPPTGDCNQFLNIHDASTFAQAPAPFTDTPSSTHLSTVPLTVYASSVAQEYGRCSLSYPGIRFAAKDAVVLVKFTVPVKFLNDDMGNVLLHEDPDGTWFITQCIYSSSDSTTYNPNFQFTSSDRSLENATCSMYVSETDAVLAANNGGQATVGPIAVYTIPMTLSWATVVTNAQVPSGRSSGIFTKSTTMDNKVVSADNLWTRQASSELHCGHLCLLDVQCSSMFYLHGNSTCIGHASVHTSGGHTVSGASYYILQ